MVEKTSKIEYNIKFIKKDEKESEICSECNKEIIYDKNRGLMVCNHCGLVDSEKNIDTGPDWRTYNHNQFKARIRTGPPRSYMLHDKGLYTIIGYSNKDINGNQISSHLRGQIDRLRKWHSRLRISNAMERNLAIAICELNRIASIIKLNKNVQERAIKFYRNALKKKLIRGRRIEGIVAACLYAACRDYRIPCTLSEIAEVSRVGMKEIGRSYRHISAGLILKLNPTKAVDFLPRFISELELSIETQKIAKKIINEAEMRGMTSGRMANSICAAGIAAATIISGERRTLTRICEISGIVMVTLKHRIIELSEVLNLML